ncbi:MAG: hypothetical protein GDA43_24500 [Hormoscilla sp. SP5CHS1]|nr:hypothetical protein [Hormoscilla sp. SP12CHS1]MBC6455952.1 hypothetical protein [Hormoscilla sp. SP5CHS1]
MNCNGCKQKTQAATELGLSSIPTGTFTVPEKSAAAPVPRQSETAAHPDRAAARSASQTRSFYRAQN